MSVLCSMVGASFTVAAAAQVLRSKKAIYGNVTKPQIDTAQSKFGGASALYDGSGDYLVAGSTGDFLFPPGSDVTMELWFRIDTALTGEYNGLISMGNSRGSSSNEFFIYIETSSSTGFNRRLRLGHNFNNLVSSSTNLNLNQWYHVAATRSGTTFTLWLDGVSQGTSTNTLTLGQNTGGKIGALADGSLFFNKGHLDEIRISDTARYTANFTPATAAFVNDANTLFLMHADGTDASIFFEDDNGVRASRSIVASGGAQVSTTQNKFGGTSLSLDGTGDYLNVGETGDFAFGTGNFTIEAFIRNTKASSTRKSGIFSKRNFDNINSGGWGLYLTTDDGKIGWEQLFSGGTAYEISTTISANTWYHVAVVRNGSAMNIYIDGTSRASWTDSTNYTNVNQLKIGTFWDSTQGNTPTDSVAWQGFIDEMRISDTARYTSAFTAPTAPFVNDSNTLLLIHADGTNAATVFRDDNGAVPFSTRTAKTITAVGNAQVDTAQFKYGSSSALFDGTGDAITIAHNGEMRFGTGDFTMEFWYRPNARTQTYPVVFSNKNGFDAGNIVFHDRHASNTTKLTVWIYNFNTGAPIFTATTTTVNGTWYHIALSRSGTSLKLFVNGTQEGSTYTTSADIDTGAGTTDYQLSSPGNSSEYNGHIDEVRISNIARYTANFTPTGPFNSDPNTMLLMHMEGTDASTTFTDDVFGVRTQKGIQAVGNAQIDTAQSKFGGSSFLGDGTGDYLQLPTESSLELTGNFTVEMWYRIPSTVPAILPFYNSDHLFYLTNDGGTAKYALFSGGSNRLLSSGITVSANTWYHFAMVRSGTTITAYHNGTSAGSATWASTISGTTPTIGSYSSYFINGHYDEIRISNSARYTANFTPSTTPFQNDANTVLLLHMDGTDGSTVFFDDNGIAPYTP